RSSGVRPAAAAGVQRPNLVVHAALYSGFFARCRVMSGIMTPRTFEYRTDGATPIDCRRGREPDHVGDAARDERGRAAPQGARPHAVFSDLELHAGAGEPPAEAAPRAGRAAGASVARPRAAP